MKNKKLWIIISVVSGFTAVSIGAFGAHGLKSILTPEMSEVYRTGILYHLIHSAVLLALSLNSKYKLITPFYFILTGILLFSFSLYVYSISGILFFAMITPIGGVCFIIGWLSIIYVILKNKV